MKTSIETEIEIDASADAVWAILADFDGFAEWNRFIRRIDGGSKVGDKLVVELWLSDRKPMTVKPRLVAYDPGRELRWAGRLLIPGLFDGEHSFVIEPLENDRVRFVHRETFRGLLVGPVLKRMRRKIETAFKSMNSALKARAEASPKTSSPG